MALKREPLITTAIGVTWIPSIPEAVPAVPAQLTLPPLTVPGRGFLPFCTFAFFFFFKRRKLFLLEAGNEPGALFLAHVGSHEQQQDVHHAQKKKKGGTAMRFPLPPALAPQSQAWLHVEHNCLMQL